MAALHERPARGPAPFPSKSELRRPPDKYLTASRDPVMSRDKHAFGTNFRKSSEVDP